MARILMSSLFCLFIAGCGDTIVYVTVGEDLGVVDDPDGGQVPADLGGGGQVDLGGPTTDAGVSCSNAPELGTTEYTVATNNCPDPLSGTTGLTTLTVYRGMCSELVYSFRSPSVHIDTNPDGRGCDGVRNTQEPIAGRIPWSSVAGGVSMTPFTCVGRLYTTRTATEVVSVPYTCKLFILLDTVTMDCYLAGGPYYTPPALFNRCTVTLTQTSHLAL